MALFAVNGLTVRLEDNWTDATSSLQKVYSVDCFLTAAQDHLSQVPPDLVQASEKLWGCVAHVIQQFYADLHICVKSHRATRALGLFAIQLSAFAAVGAKLALAYKNGEDAYKNFYRPEFSKSEIEEMKTTITFFAREFLKIDRAQVNEELQPYVNGEMATGRELGFITFTKCNVTERIGKHRYVAKFLAI